MKQITFLCFSILLTFSITACKSKPKQESKKIFYEVIGRDDAGARYKHMQSSYSISISSVYFISAEENSFYISPSYSDVDSYSENIVHIFIDFAELAKKNWNYDSEDFSKKSSKPYNGSDSDAIGGKPGWTTKTGTLTIPELGKFSWLELVALDQSHLDSYDRNCEHKISLYRDIPVPIYIDIDTGDVCSGSADWYKKEEKVLEVIKTLRYEGSSAKGKKATP